MKRSGILAVAVLLAAAPALRAQSSGQPNLILSISGGVTGGGSLWEVPHQLAVAPNGAFDTLALGRRLRPGIVAAFDALYHPSPHLGYVVEIAFFGVGSEGRCAQVNPSRAWAPDADNKNQQACTRVQGAHVNTNVIGFQGGLVYRVAPTARFSPYVRATAGLGALGPSYVTTAAEILAAACDSFGTCTYELLREPSRTSATWVATLAAGLTVASGPGYQFRFEARDLITALPIAADSVSPFTVGFPNAPVAMRTRHIFTLTAGLDVVLERRHRRRY